tara:strand:- start:130 stop:786 length:657 start_codon:yes stop_codon:yes gene_type:complete
MKKIIISALFSVLCFEKGNAQQYDYTDDLYLAIGGIDFGNMCGFDSPNYQPGDVFQYSTHVWIDLKKLYNIPYRRNTFFNGNLTFWTTFGGYGHPTEPNKGWAGGQIDDNKKTFVASGPFGVGLLKFANVKIPGTSSSWGTGIWINVFSQCHNQCSQGTWWKFEKNLNADQARQFANSHKYPNSTDSYVNGTNVVLGHQGNPSCNPTAVYGFGFGELN